jgi:hypothetical protein
VIKLSEHEADDSVSLVPRFMCAAVPPLPDKWKLVKRTKKFCLYTILLLTEGWFYVCHLVSGGSGQVSGNNGADPSPAVTIGASQTAAGWI